MSEMKRYSRNIGAITEAENIRLRDFHVCVVGCGGLGGYVLEYVGRMGIGHITAIDGDAFDESNLNRQLLSSERLLGSSKAMAAKERMAHINSDIEVKAVSRYITEENAEDILAGHDIVIDALDNIETRRYVEKACLSLGIPLVHGAVSGWYGQVTSIMPANANVFDRIYPKKESASPSGEASNESVQGILSFVPALVASIEAAEAVKILLGRGGALDGKLLTVDLLTQEYEIFEI